MGLEILNQLQRNPNSLEQAKRQKKNEICGLVREDSTSFSHGWRFNGTIHDQNWLLYDKVTVLESEKRAWENSAEAQTMRDALNPWRQHDAGTRKSS